MSLMLPGHTVPPSRCSPHGHGKPEPLGLEYVASALGSAGLPCRWRGWRECEVRRNGKAVSFFSALTHEYPQVLLAAEAARKRGNLTVCGGFHVCGCAEALTNGPFDYFVVGEGEAVAPAIAKAHLSVAPNNLERFAPSGLGTAKVIRPPRIAEVDALPFPVRFWDRLAQYRIYDLMWPPSSRQRGTGLVLASRGCVNDCGFCASSAVWGRGVRLRSARGVVEELRGLVEAFGTNTVVFIDQSLGQAAQWTRDLCRAIQDADLGIHWYHQSNLTVDRGVVRAMADAGCTKIGFGLEGISPLAVERIKPHNPHDFGAVNDLLDYCNSLGLLTKVYLMIGFPWETDDIVQEYFQWLPRLRANQIKISYFTPFPGTRAWDCYSAQLATRDWADFDTVRMPVVQNPQISVEQYHQVRKDLFQAFYGSPMYADVTQRMLARFPRYELSYWEFAAYLKAFRMITGRERWLDWVGRGAEVTA